MSRKNQKRLVVEWAPVQVYTVYLCKKNFIIFLNKIKK